MENNNKEISVSNRQAAWLFSGLLIIGFFVFIAGYFLGQRHAVQTFSQKADQESLADQISSSLFMLYDAAPQEEDDVEMSDGEDETSLAEQDPTVLDDDLPEETQESELSEPAVPSAVPERIEQYYAKLIGFGTQRAAERFSQKLQKQGIPVEVKSYPSKSARGRKITWYQVVTKAYTNKDELEQLVAQVSKRERLKGVQITVV